MRSSLPMRVLFVVPSSYWITAVQAREIMKQNPEIKGVLCSVPLLDELLRRAPYVAENLDLVHFMVPVAGRRYLDRFLGKVPCVTTIHHIEPGYVPEAVTTNAAADGIMVVAEVWRSELVSRGVHADRIVVVPNGVDTTAFRPPNPSERFELRRSLGFAPNEIVIGFVGQAGRDGGWRKGVDVFIESLKILSQQDLRIAAVVGGPGWETAIAKIRAIGIKTYWRRYLPNAEDVAPMYRALDFYWVTSRIEGGPVPLLEAMSSGVCCISTRVGVAPEVIEDGVNGCLVDIGDAPRIAALTRELADRTEERLMMGREASSTIYSGYDWSHTAKRASLLYNTAMANFERRFLLTSEQETRLQTCDTRRFPGTSRVDDGTILSPRDAQWLDSQEQLVWSRELCRMGEWREAICQGWRACLANPLSARTYALVANLFLARRVLAGARLLRS